MSVNSRPIVILALLIFVSGCVAQRQSGYVKVLQPISPEQLSHVDKIGVIVDPACVLKERLPKVAKGASEGAEASIRQGDFTPHEPAGLLLLPIVLPLAVGMAAVVGAIRAHPAEEVNETEQVIRDTISESDPINRLVSKLEMKGEDILDIDFVACSNSMGEDSFSDEFESNIDYEIVLHDLLISLPVSGYDPGSKHYFSPDVSIIIHARLEITDKKDQAVLYKGVWLYKGPRFDYLEIDENRDMFQKEIEAGIDAIANAVIRDVFLEPRSIVVRSDGVTIINKQQERTVERLDRLWK